MKRSLNSITVLVCICAVIAVLLAFTNEITLPIIEENEKKAANDALLEVLPDGEEFESVDISLYSLPPTITEAYSEKNGGYVFKLETTGYASGFVIMCGVNSNGAVSGAICLSSNETLGYEKIFGKWLVGKNADSIGVIDTVSGATKTTNAYKNAVMDAIKAADILGSAAEK